MQGHIVNASDLPCKLTLICVICQNWHSNQFMICWDKHSSSHGMIFFKSIYNGAKSLMIVSYRKRKRWHFLYFAICNVMASVDCVMLFFISDKVAIALIFGYMSWHRHEHNLYIILYPKIYNIVNNPGSKFHGANMGPTWWPQKGSVFGPLNLAIRECSIINYNKPLTWSQHSSLLYPLLQRSWKGCFLVSPCPFVCPTVGKIMSTL